MLSFAGVEKNDVLSFLVTEDGAATANEYCAISGGTENGSVNMTENGSVFYVWSTPLPKHLRLLAVP